MFGDTVITSAGKLAPEIQAIYDNTLDIAKTKKMRWGKYALKASVKKNGNTLTAMVYKYLNLQPALTKLAEFNGGNYKASTNIERVKRTYSVGRYGDYLYVEEKLKLVDLDNIKNSYLDIFGKQGALTDEYIIMSSVSAGSQVVFADNAADLNAVADGDKKITLSDLDLIEVYLVNAGVERVSEAHSGTRQIGTVPMPESYVVMADISVCKDLSTLPGFQFAHTYTGQKHDGEYGMVGKFTVIENPITKTQTVNDKKIYTTTVFGAEAYSSVTLDGESKCRVIVKPANDPLELAESLGWKGWMGADIVDQYAIFNIFSVANINDNRPNPNYSN